MSTYTHPDLDQSTIDKVIAQLEPRLASLADLQLTLKHIHWNVTGPNFIAVHEMLDDQVVKIRAMTDAVAERIALLGGVPKGTPGAIVNTRTWEEYTVGRASATEHLEALSAVYQGVIKDHRTAMRECEELDLVTHDLLNDQTGDLELFEWFVRSHLA